MISLELLLEWDYEKNSAAGLDPFSLSVSSGKKAGWICEKGHRWDAKISNRNLGQGCPYCLNHKILQGYNDLATVNPEIASQWDFDKNDSSGLLPTTVGAGSGKKVWWKCNKGHSWQAQVYVRVTKGQSCPYCDNRQVLSGYNDLATVNPILASEWDYTKNDEIGLHPDSVLPGSHQKAWWKCALSHSWQAIIYTRNNGVGCPYCAGNKISSGTNDFATKCPELLVEWDYRKNNELGFYPERISASSPKKVWWICPKGHEWTASVHNRWKGNGCPICSNYKVVIGVNDLATTNPELAEEWNYERNATLGMTPNNMTAGSNKSAWWKCKKGHEWESIIANRLKGSGCPYCSKELRTSFPEQAIFYYMKHFFGDCVNGDKKTIYPMELDVYIPSLKTAVEYDGKTWHSGKNAIERDNTKNRICANKGIRLFRVREDGCDELDEIPGVTIYHYKYGDNLELEKIINSIISTICGFECSVDIEKDRSEIVNLLITREKAKNIVSVNPELLSEWDYEKNKISPESVSYGSQIKVWWKCSLGHSWQMDVANRANGRKCPYCTNRKVLEGFNDLATTNPELVSEWDFDKNANVSPDTITRGSDKKVWWKCEKGHSWEATVSSRTNRKNGVGCPYCSKRGKLLSGFNDLATTNPELAQEWIYDKNGDLTPSLVTKGQHLKVWWKCSNGHEWEALIANRIKGRGCPYCSGKIVVAGINDLATLMPELAKEWNYEKNDLLVTQVSPGSGKKVWWKCSEGHEWEAIISNRKKGYGCPQCWQMSRRRSKDVDI